MASGGGGGSGGPLAGLGSGLHVIEDPVALDVSSSKLRAALQQVRFLFIFNL